MHSFGQDSTKTINTTLEYKGQLSSWAHLNLDNAYPLYAGARYIPQLNYEVQITKQKLIDFETSANLYGDVGFQFFDSLKTNGDIKPYRIWGRYSGKQFEIRAGLQKINFGPAKMMRALRWFDRLDPRDPLQITDGVYGLLTRYYFLNNTNIWAWGLYGNNTTKGMEILPTHKEIPEFGGRLQTPIPAGEAAISYHHRTATTEAPLSALYPFEKIPENRIGLDTKLDVIVGLWFEASWTTKSENIEMLTNQEMISVGSDYTFGIANGLNISVEHLLFSSDKSAFAFENTQNFTALSANYAFGLFDTVNTIFYYNWNTENMYSFINWFKQFNKTSLYIMGYWNPENPQPITGNSMNLYSGKGLQIMFVYNH